MNEGFVRAPDNNHKLPFLQTSLFFVFSSLSSQPTGSSITRCSGAHHACAVTLITQPTRVWVLHVVLQQYSTTLTDDSHPTRSTSDCYFFLFHQSGTHDGQRKANEWWLVFGVSTDTANTSVTSSSLFQGQDGALNLFINVARNTFSIVEKRGISKRPLNMSRAKQANRRLEHAKTMRAKMCSTCCCHFSTWVNLRKKKSAKQKSFKKKCLVGKVSVKVTGKW